eukprot:scaffold18931_cov62-Attheya_sp.AAC.11
MPLASTNLHSLAYELKTTIWEMIRGQQIREDGGKDKNEYWIPYGYYFPGWFALCCCFGPTVPDQYQTSLIKVSDDEKKNAGHRSSRASTMEKEDTAIAFRTCTDRGGCGVLLGCIVPKIVAVVYFFHEKLATAAWSLIEAAERACQVSDDGITSTTAAPSDRVTGTSPLTPSPNNRMNPFPRLSALIGALVKVDPEHRTDRPDSEGGKGWVRNFEPDGKATVQYLIDGRVSLGILSNRLHQASLSTCARSRGRGPLPLLLSREHHRIAQLQNRLPPIDDNPLLVHLRDGRKKDKGCIRGHEAIIAERVVPKMNSYLILPERELVVQCMVIISSIVPETMHPEGSHPVADLAYGFGVSRQCIQAMDIRILSRNNDASRKRRCDAGETVFTLNKKQAAVFTSHHYYKKWRHLNVPGEVFDDLELGRDLELLNERDTQHFEEGAASFQEAGTISFL